MNMLRARLADVLSRGWWQLLFRGLAAIAFGVFTMMRPGISLATLVLLFGVYAIIDGVMGVWVAIAGRKEMDNWWALLLWGLVSLAVGALTFLTPGITALAFLFYIAVWAIARGVLEIVSAIRLRKEIQGEWILVLAGAASVAFGAILIARPGEGALAVLWLIAVYAIVVGALFTVLALKLRNVAKVLATA